MVFSGKEKEEFIRLTVELEDLKNQIAQLTQKNRELEQHLNQLKHTDSVLSNFRANLSIPVVFFDATLKTIYANHKFAEFFERPLKSIMGQNIFNLLSPSSQGTYSDIDSFFMTELNGKKNQILRTIGDKEKSITLLDFEKVRDSNGNVSFGYIVFNEYRDPHEKINTRNKRIDVLEKPLNVKETGLSMDFISELILKTIYSYGEMTNIQISEELRLPLEGVIRPVMTFLKKDLGYCANIAVSEENVGKTERYINVLTDKGRERVREAIERNQYVGPAPVPLEFYKKIVAQQRGNTHTVKISDIKESLPNLVFDDKIFKKLTTAINSRESIFVHGEPGNGKSSIAKVCSGINRKFIILPYAIEIDGQIIKVFDSVFHRLLSDEELKKLGLTEDMDRRWAICEPPIIILGGELGLDDLELQYDPISKFYEAPSQIKANGGTLVIDDFGRQKVSPGALLNRWMVPLEEKIDFMRLHTGKQIVVPMDILLVFSTNISPGNLGDEAFFRRLKNKIYVPDPNAENFNKIFMICCNNLGFEYSKEIYSYVISRLDALSKPLRGYIPRDLLTSAAAAAETDSPDEASANINSANIKLTKDLIDEAFENCFI